MAEDVETIRARARERVAGRQSMVVDGDVIEELARAFERHAERVRKSILELTDVGRLNHLGNTSEGRTATTNIRASAVEHPRSLRASLMANEHGARAMADNLRAISGMIERADSVSEASIRESGTASL
ncbi:hypothetical protein [Tsukamurella soli]|uniref:Uncharacterized protein n=1 Tax=Tsukamurella soli TaxID=644556 RepID=A0ABP8J1U6_9ACTN